MPWKSLLVLFAAGLAACTSLVEPRCVSNAECARGICLAGQCVEEDARDGSNDTDPADSTDRDTDPDATPTDTGDITGDVTDPDTADTTDTTDVTDPDTADTTDTTDVTDPDTADTTDVTDPDTADTTDTTDVTDTDCVERNECGGCSTLTSPPETACGPCLLDQYECEGEEATVCSGATLCTQPAVALDAPLVVDETKISLGGSILSFGIGAESAEAHGFCFSSTGSPTAGASGAECVDLGVTSDEGPFSAELEDLSPGTPYRIRAFLTAGGLTVYSAERTAITLPAAPPGLVASRGTIAEHVLLEWTGTQGADGYFIFRDGERIGSTEHTLWTDIDIAPGTLPSVASAEATQGTRTDGVEIEWLPATTNAGPPADYWVVAYNATGDSASSPVATGFRAGFTVSHYELRVSGEEGDPWLDLGDATSYLATDAPRPTLQAGTLEASKGDNPFFVSLATTGATATPPTPTQWEIRAVSEEGGPGPTITVTGYRGAGPLSYTWQRSPVADPAIDGGGDFVTIGQGDTPAWQDANAPAPGTSGIGDSRWYRVLVEADGTDPVLSNVDEGYRANLGPPVRTDAVADVTATGARLRGSFDDTSAGPPVDDHGFCIGPNPNPSFAPGATCVSLGTLANYAPFETLRTDLTPGATYHYRAWGQDETGLSYGSNVVFSTLPGVPTNVQATDGTLADRVRVSWTAAPGAAEYEVVRLVPAAAGSDPIEEVLTTTTRLFYDHSGAPSGAYADSEFDFTVSQGTFTDRVVLQWNPTPTGTPGESVTYGVRARNASGDSPLGVATGRAGPPSIIGFRPLANGEAIAPGLGGVLPSATSSFDHLTAPPGQITSATVTASEGTSLTFIEVGVKGAELLPGAEVNYTLVAIYRDLDAQHIAGGAGYRGVGVLSATWERRTAPSGPWVDLTQTSLAFKDNEGDVDPDRSIYRVTLSAIGVPDPIQELSNPGYRAPDSVRYIASGSAHTCALYASGDVRCWGDNQHGQLGIGSTSPVGVRGANMPPPVAQLGGAATALSVGLNHNCAILESGEVVCWGRNQSGQLGTGDTVNVGHTPASLPPLPVPLPSEYVPTQISAGNDFSCVAGNARGRQAVFCWGNQADWRLGIPTGGVDSLRYVPSDPVEGVAVDLPITAMVSGAAHSCLYQGTRVRCWGSNSSGQLFRTGGSGPAALAGPSLTGGLLTNVRQLAAGGNVSCAIHSASDDLTCWGSNSSGQLGLSSNLSAYGSGSNIVLLTVPLARGAAARTVSTSGLHTCVGSDDETFCFGRNFNGQLAIGSTALSYGLGRFDASLDPNLLEAGATLVSTGAAHSCFQVDRREEVFECYGRHDDGRLGNRARNDIGSDPSHIPTDATRLFE